MSSETRIASPAPARERRSGGLAAAVRLLATTLLVGNLAACAPWTALPGPAVVAPRLEADGIRMADGVTLPLRRWGPRDDPRAVVLALHGFNDYSNAFETPAAVLSEARVALYAYDQRGFGEAPNRGVWPGTDGMIADAETAARLIRGAHPGKPFFLLGESMGAAVLMAAMDRSGRRLDADGYILSAPAVLGRQVMPQWQRVGLDLFAHTIPLFTVSGRGLNRMPSDNIEMLRALSRDPLVIKHTRIDAIYGLVNLMGAALDAAPRLAERTLILLGKHEDIVPDAAVRALLADLPENRCVQVARYPSGHHMLLRDLKRDIVLADIVAWISGPGLALPSGADGTRLAAAEESGAARSVGLDCAAPIAARP